MADGDVNFEDSENEWEDMPQAKASDQDKPLKGRSRKRGRDGSKEVKSFFGNCCENWIFFGDQHPFTSMWGFP